MAVYTKTLTAEFFKVEVTSGQKFEQIVSNVAAKGIGKDTTLEVKDDFFTRLEQAGNWGDDSVEGHIVRLRMNSLPDKAGFSEPLQPIGFTEDEGVGESAAFIFHKPSAVLLLERNRNAVTTYTFAEFFRQLGQLQGHINLHPVLEHDVYERVFNAKVLRKIIVRLAGPDNIGAALSEMEPSVGEMVKARRSLKAPVAEFRYTVGRSRKEALDLPNGLGTIRDFLRLGRSDQAQIETLIVHGSLGPHDDFHVDLLEHHLTGTDTVDTNRDRRIPYERKRDALRRIWMKQKNEIEKIFTKQ